MSKHGKYGVKLHLNGTERLIDIDDRIVFNVKSKFYFFTNLNLEQKHSFCVYEPL